MVNKPFKQKIIWMNGKINKKKNSYISSEKLINDKTNSKNKKENIELIIIIIFSLFTYFSNLIYKLLIFTGIKFN